MAKKRIYEVARELGIPSRDVVKRAQSLGLEVTTASSGLDSAALERVLRSFEDHTAEPPSPATSVDEPATADAGSDMDTTSDGSAAVGSSDTTVVNVVERPVDAERSMPESAAISRAERDAPYRPPLAAATGLPKRSGTAFGLVALVVIVANGIVRISVDAGVVAHGVAVAMAISFVLFHRGEPVLDRLPARAWLFGSMALVPTIPLAMATIRPIPDWAVPMVFAVPVGLGAVWILIILPDWRVAGLRILTWDGVAWSLIALPFIGIAALSGFGDMDVFLGASDTGMELVRVLVLVGVALVIMIVYYGLVQGFAEPLVGLLTVPWIGLMFASTFAASWRGFAFLLVFGLAAGVMRMRFGAIWPGFISAAIVATALAIW